MKRLLILILLLCFNFLLVFNSVAQNYDEEILIPRKVAEFYHIKFIEGKQLEERLILTEEKLEKKKSELELTNILIESYKRDSTNYDLIINDLKSINDIRESEVKSLKRDVLKFKILLKLTVVTSAVVAILVII